MNYYDPVAILKNRKMELSIKELPAKLGRNNNVVDVYLFHESVSREHCLFECINRRFTLRDLGSTVGTFINGVRLEPNVPYNIEDGAKIQIGKVKLVFHPDYHALAEWERRQAQPAQAAPAVQQNMYGTDAAAPQSVYQRETSAPAGKKTVSVSVRELSDFEYDVEEVIYIDCGLKPEKKALSYTSEIRKKALEEAQAESSGLEDEIAEEAEPITWTNTQVLDPGVSARLEAAVREKEAEAAEMEAEAAEMEAEAAVKDDEFVDDLADEGTFKIEEAQETEEPGKVLHLTWIDDISGETKKLKIDHFPFSIGRKSDVNDYTIARKGISRKHLRFEEADGEICIYDDASTNGVRVNGEKIAPETLIRLNSGDSIRVLDITFAVKID